MLRFVNRWKRNGVNLGMEHVGDGIGDSIGNLLQSMTLGCFPY